MLEDTFSKIKKIKNCTKKWGKFYNSFRQKTPYRSVQYLFNRNNQDVVFVDIIEFFFANGIGIESSKRKQVPQEQ